MSTNITHFEVITISGLTIDKSALKGLHFQELPDGKLVYSLNCEYGNMIGRTYDESIMQPESISMPNDVVKQVLHIETIEFGSEGSGHAYESTLLPLLRQTRGLFDALATWEGGDSLTRIHVNNGVVTESEVNVSMLIRENDQLHTSLRAALSTPAPAPIMMQGDGALIEAAALAMGKYSDLVGRIVKMVDELKPDDLAQAMIALRAELLSGGNNG